jgi:uncharacterized membrane protein
VAHKANRTKQKAAAAHASGTATAGTRDWAQLAVALVGMIVTAILLWATASSSALPYCADGSSCDIVQASAWSRFLGLPLPLWGLLTYLTLAAVALSRPSLRRRRLCTLIASSGFVVSIYLTAVSGFLIGAFCGYCLLSLGLMTLAFVFSLRPRESSGALQARFAGLLTAVGIAALMHANATGMLGGAGPIDPQLRELAEHLSARGAKFYGASWCPHCQQQKDLFGAAGSFLPYVECSPHGSKAPRATACEVQDINNYPTWIIDGRRIERVLPVAALATISGYQAQLDASASPPAAH